jgi:hypothetical protein
MNLLTTDDLKNLIISVFSPRKSDKRLVIIADVPDGKIKETKAWQQRREIALDWFNKLISIKDILQLEKVSLLFYQNVHNNNADLPKQAYFFQGEVKNLNASSLLAKGISIDFERELSQTQLVIAPTQFSATAPLKLLANKYHFRAATMPGFSAQMIPALKLDYEEINRRVTKIKNLLDPAVAMEIKFSTSENQKFRVHFDLRYRLAHVSGGRFPEPGSAGNLPSGECYIVPYEGEKGAPSESAGVLPVQFEDEIVLYQINQNFANQVISSGKISKQEAEKLEHEPAYGNIAEIGFGVLRDFGVQPIGEILLDEKLGLHIAFGRSDHFGGKVGVADFSNHENVVHIDRIYIPKIQSKVTPRQVELIYDDGHKFLLMECGEYKIF